MKRIVLFFLFCVAACLSACGAHEHTFSEPDCVNPAICSKCNETSGTPLGHTTIVGVCQRCGDTQSAEIMGMLNSSFAAIMDEGTAAIEKIANIGSLSGDMQVSRFAEVDTHMERIVSDLNSIIDICGEITELERIAYQAKLLSASCTDAFAEGDGISAGGRVALYQLTLQQMSSSFNYFAEDMDYLAGNSVLPAKVEYYTEVPQMPTPDSVIYGISLDSAKTSAGVKQYIYLIGDDSEDANLNYNIFLRAIEMSGILQYEVTDGDFVFVTEEGDMVSLIKAGTDSQLGYFMIVSFST